MIKLSLSLCIIVFETKGNEAVPSQNGLNFADNNFKWISWSEEFEFGSKFHWHPGVQLKSILGSGADLALGMITRNWKKKIIPDSKVREAYMGLTRGRQHPGGPHVGPLNLVIRDVLLYTQNLLCPLTRTAYMHPWTLSAFVQVCLVACSASSHYLNTNADLLSIEPSGTNFSEVLIKIQTFSFMKMHWKMSSAK